MPFLPLDLPTAPLTHLPFMVPIEGGIVAMGSHALNNRLHNCPPRLVEVDSFSMAETAVTVGLQREVMGGVEGRKGVVEDEAPDNFPAMLSWDNTFALAREIAVRTGRKTGIPTDAEWEYAARNFIPDVRRFMEEHRELGLRRIVHLQEWLIKGGGYLENFVPLERGEVLTLGSRLVTDPEDPEFLEVLEAAAVISCWTMYGTRSGGLKPEEAYYGQGQRGPVRHGYHPNSKGLYDMTGGMLEWCADYYYQRETRETYPKSEPSYLSWLPAGALELFAIGGSESDRYRHVQRGGAWSDKGDSDDLLVAFRSGDRPVDCNDDLGARLAGDYLPDLDGSE